MTACFTITHRVEFAETDMAGIMHFSNYYRWMERVEHEFFRSLGLSIMQTQGDGSIIGWPRVSASCSFEAPAYHEDLLDIQLTVTRKGVKSLTMEFEFQRDGARLAHGQMKTVCCQICPGEPMKSIAIPDAINKKIGEQPPTSKLKRT